MLFLTHLYFASKTATRFRIRNHGDYYLGAVIPGIRYMSDIPFEATHIKLNEVQDTFTHNKDFAWGYYQHLLLDRIADETDIFNRIRQNGPFLLKTIGTNGLIELLIEVYVMDYFKKLPERIRISKAFDEGMIKMGVNGDLIDLLVNNLNFVLGRLDFDAIDEVIARTSTIKNGYKLEIYRKLGRFLMTNKWVYRQLAWKIPIYLEFLLTAYANELIKKAENENMRNGELDDQVIPHHMHERIK